MKHLLALMSVINIKNENGSYRVFGSGRGAKHSLSMGVIPALQLHAWQHGLLTATQNEHQKQMDGSHGVSGAHPGSWSLGQFWLRDTCGKWICAKYIITTCVHKHTRLVHIVQLVFLFISGSKHSKHCVCKVNFQYKSLWVIWLDFYRNRSIWLWTEDVSHLYSSPPEKKEV